MEKIEIPIKFFDEFIRAIKLENWRVIEKGVKYLEKIKYEQEIENTVFVDQKVIDQKPIKMKF